MRRLTHAVTLATLVLFAACGTEPGPTEALPEVEASFAKGGKKGGGGGSAAASDLDATLNAGAAERGYAVATMEYYTDPGSGQMGQTVFFNDRGNKQLASDFVPGDPRRGWGDGISILYRIDPTDGATASGLTAGQTTAAIVRAMDTWQGVTCSDPGLTGGLTGGDVGFVQFLLGFGGSPSFSHDITHGGWLPKAFFDALAPGGGTSILGVTFTFVWVDANGPTDIDNNGKADVAFREIYYNDNFSWADDGVHHIDVETVALHEAGHGLSQAHFGKLFRTDKNGKFHFAPRALMNAAYSGVQTEITATDNGGHCSNWAEWPNN